MVVKNVVEKSQMESVSSLVEPSFCPNGPQHESSVFERNQQVLADKQIVENFRLYRIDYTLYDN